MKKCFLMLSCCTSCVFLPDVIHQICDVVCRELLGPLYKYLEGEERGRQVVVKSTCFLISVFT